MVYLQLLILLCLEEGGKAGTMGGEGYGVVSQGFGVFGVVFLEFFIVGFNDI